MNRLRRILAQLPIGVLIVICLTLGLAPFAPEPHVWEKLRMLAGGTLTRPVDVFDLALHGLPWLLLALRLAIASWTTGAPRD